MNTNHPDPTNTNRCPSCGRSLHPDNTACPHCIQQQKRISYEADRERRLLGELHDAGKAMLP